MKTLVGAFNQEKALVGAFSVIVQPVVEPMEHYTALVLGAEHQARVQRIHREQEPRVLHRGRLRHARGAAGADVEL